MRKIGKKGEGVDGGRGGENIAFGLSLFTLSVGGGVSMHELTFKTCVTRKNI